MKKQRKKLALNTFKIAKLTINHSSIIKGGRSGHNTIDATVNGTRGSSACPDTYTDPNTDTITVVDTNNSSIPCANEFKTYGGC